MKDGTPSSESTLESRRERLEEARFVGYFTAEDFAFCRGITVASVRGTLYRGSIRKIRKPGVRGWVIPFSEWDREEEPEERSAPPASERRAPARRRGHQRILKVVEDGQKVFFP